MFQLAIRLLAISISSLVAGVAWAACPVTLTVGERDANGRLPVTTSTNGSCGASGLDVFIAGAHVASAACDTPTCQRTFFFDTACWGSAARSIEAKASCHFTSGSSCVRHTGTSGVQSIAVDNRPTVGLAMSAVNTSWRTTATITGRFQTRANGTQWARLVRGTNINDVVAERNFSNGEQDFTWTVSVDLTCQKGPLRLQAIAMTCGAVSGCIGCSHIPSDPSLIGRSDVATVDFDPQPTAALSIPEPGQTGATTATVTGVFPFKVNGRRYVQLFRNGNINDVVREVRPDDTALEVTFTVGLDFACTSGTTTYQAAAMMCGDPAGVIGGNHVPSDPAFIGYSREVTMKDEAKPEVSVSYTTDAAGNDLGAVQYSFPSTSSQQQRDLEIFIDGVRSTVSMATHFGTHPVALPSCWKTFRAVATSCDRPGNAAFTDEDQVQAPHLTPTVGVSLAKKGINPAAGRREIEVSVTYDLKRSGGKVRVDLLSWRDADGREHAGGELKLLNPAPQQAGTHTFTFTPPWAAQHVRVLATAEGCGFATADASIACDTCDGATAEPVFFSDGNMRLTDLDPLPPIAGTTLSRVYNSDEQVGALFGRGWSTIFDRRLMIDTHATSQTVSLTTDTNEVVTFRGADGAFVQTWPLAQHATGTLTHDAAAGTYSYREPGSTELAVFRASDGRFVATRDLGSGREARMTYDAQGLPQTLTDSWTGLTWTLAIDAAERRVSSITAGTLVWTYSYDANGNLLAVTAPGSTAWRTYEYVNNRMTASRDALGNLIESHTYDSDGYAISSIGRIDEVANIQYNLTTATPGERITRVTQNSGAVTDYILRPSGGGYRTVGVVNGCSSCGARNATYIRDARGRIIREQSADGYVTQRVYTADRLASEQTHMKLVGCDPAADPAHCRLDATALGAASLEATTATTTVSYTYGNTSWPEKPTEIATQSVLQPGQLRRESITYDAASGATLIRSTSGWTGSPARFETRTTATTLYNGTEGAAFTPGGAFETAWLTLPQPRAMRKSVDGPRTDPQDVTSFVYYPVDTSVPANARGRLAATKNAAGHITRFEAYDAFGNATRMVDPNGIATESTYDTLGRPLTQTIKGVSGCDTTADPLCATDLTTRRSYSPASGPLSTEQRPSGGKMTYTYDTRGRVLTTSRGSDSVQYERIETSYDSATGKKSFDRYLANEQGVCIEKRRDAFTYDTLGQLQTVAHPDKTSIGYSYDADGRLAGVRDENHTSPNTRYTYDPAGRIATVEQTLGSGAVTTRYTYDVHGNLASVTDPNGNITRYTYDDFGAMLAQQSPVTGTTTYEYDIAGNLTRTSDANSAATTRTYDALGRVLTATSVRGSATETVTWTYDDPATGRFAIGRVASMSDPAGKTTYDYERRGLLRTETRTFTSTTEPYVTRFTYTADGERASIVYPSGMTVSYTYDWAGRPYGVGTNVLFLVWGAGYLPFGPLKDILYTNGTYQLMEFDARYRMTKNRLSLTGPSKATIAEYNYTYDASGNITAIADALTPAYNRTFGYDDLNRLTTANSGTALWGTGSYTYDAMGNMLSSKIGDPALTTLAKEAYFTHVGTTPKIATVRNTPLNDPGEFTAPSHPELQMRRKAVGYHTVSYDAAGNELSYVATRTYSPRNLLESVTDPGETPSDAHRLKYQYDGRGIRVIRSESQGGGGDATRYFVYSPELQLLSVTNDDAPNVWSMRTVRTHSVPSPKHEFIWFGDMPLAQVSPTFPGPAHLYFNDHLGTPILQTDFWSNTVWRAEYEPYGDIWTMRVPADSEESPAPFRFEQPLRFPGQEAAMTWEGTEERYNVHRWYRSGFGRYTQADPIGIVRGGGEITHHYAYGANAPLTFIDPYGLDAATQDKGIQDCIYCAFHRGGQGFWGSEEALWIICDPAGGFKCKMWPATKRQGTSQRSTTSWNGPIPANTCGLAHTHPRQKPGRPSSGCKDCDVETATRLGIAIYTAHPDGVWKYDPKTKQTTREHDETYWEPIRKRCKGKVCKELPE